MATIGVAHNPRDSQESEAAGGIRRQTFRVKAPS
jgi:hypothetical protein